MTTLLDVADLTVTFRTDGGLVRAVDSVSLSVEAGETLALVGESGSGKSVTALSILGLIAPGRIEQGRIGFAGEDLTALDEAALRAIRGDRIAMIFPGAHVVPEPGG